ncbi:hypothetical protein N9E81_00445 [Algibacter sp.]|nr:hypothetical protein [Algibacter sp.]
MSLCIKPSSLNLTMMNRETNIFDKIGTLIPGYKGYQERDGRRECDRQLREQIAYLLSEIEKDINAQIEYSEINLLADIEKIRKKINTLKDLIKYSPYGASAFFSDSTIDNNELENVYQMDLDILDASRNLQESVKTKNKNNINTNIQFLEKSINNRNQYLKDI